MNEYTGNGEPTYFEAAVKLSKTGKVRGITNNIDSFVFDEENPPTKKEIEDKYAELQTDWEGKKYQRDRQYPELGEQLDMLFHDMTAGKGDKTGEWYKAVAKVKDDNPKPTE